MDIQTAKSEWERGKAWIYNFIRDFPQMENLADGVSLSQQKNAPNVGTVTLANAVRTIPRGSVQQLPSLSAEVNGTKESVDAIIASYILRRVVFNPDTFGNGILSTLQMGAQTALTQGFVAIRANVGKVFNQFSTMLETLHYNDIVIEPGVMDASNSQYYHVRTRVTKGALKALLDAAKKNKKTNWNVKALQALYDQGPQAFDYNRFLPRTQQNSGVNSEDQFDIITRYGVGPYHPIMVYSPQSEEPLMTIKSKSKFGYPRVALIVIDPAQLSPFGTSRAKLASPMANYGNIYLQSTAKMQLLNADAPVFKKGLFTTATPLRRGVQWESVDPNADVKIMELSNSTLEQFTSVMEYIDNNILSIMGVGGQMAGQSSSGYQNKDAVQSQQQTRTLASAQVTAIIENAVRQYGLTALDLYISEQVGQTPLIVDDEAKNAINEINPPQIDPTTGQPGPAFVGDDNVVNVDWKKYYDRIQTLTVTVDLSISPDQLADKKRSDTQDLFTVMKQTAGNDPQANAAADAVGQELLQDTLPDVSKHVSQQPALQAASIPAVGGAQPSAGQ